MPDATPPRYRAAKDGNGYWTVFDGTKPKAASPNEADARLLAAVFNANEAVARDGGPE